LHEAATLQMTDVLGWRARIGVLGDVATVGRGGLLGHAVVLGDTRSIVDALMQAPGAAFSLPLAIFQPRMERVDVFRLAITRAARAFFLEVDMVAACNRLHRAEQRIARWLLMTHNRVGQKISS
jgi:hypothetical protein